MADDLPRTIADLTDAEFRALINERMPLIRFRQEDLLWQRYRSLSDEALRLEKCSAEAWSAWMDTVNAVSRAHDAAMDAAKKGQSAYARAGRTYRAAEDARDAAEARRERATRAAERMRKRADAVDAALGRLREDVAEG